MTGLALVADVGGTNTRVGLARDGAVAPDTVARFANAAFADLPAVIAAYLADRRPGPIAGAAAAVAGPVRDGAARLTNRDWAITRDDLARATGAGTVSILNDLQAQGHATDRLPADRLIALIAGAPAGPNAAKLVIGVGTGFNIAPVFDTRAGRFVPPAEAGHVCLPVRNDEDRRLSAYLAERHGFPSVEEVLSGRGLGHLHGFLGGVAGRPAADILADAAAGAALAVRTVQLFARLLAQHAGDLALTLLPFGGVYLTGGVARALAPWLAGPDVAAAFRDKGRFSDFMAAFGMAIINDDFAALTGCAAHLEVLGRRPRDGDTIF
jgi:glucokinase